ncbi:Hsp20/alpha crystallin family protein [Nemorincola caseinilytica]|uniref:Hsp20/alpha crystallin family protein n=1 Tax=Nemorincola caseinilytica TaxID=2054315 RepID=A0ABP8NMA9_9BACT
MYTKTNYGMMPRTMTNLMDDLFFNGLGKGYEMASVPVNIKETKDSYELHAVAPGLKKEDFRINVDKNNLTISFDHKEEKKETDGEDKWLRSEYKTRSFKRTFTMNEKVDTTKITARYTDGVLVVTLAKKEITEPTAQEIAVN